jgi:hypothetical protein
MPASVNEESAKPGRIHFGFPFSSRISFLGGFE